MNKSNLKQFKSLPGADRRPHSYSPAKHLHIPFVPLSHSHPVRTLRGTSVTTTNSPVTEWPTHLSHKYVKIQGKTPHKSPAHPNKELYYIPRLIGKQEKIHRHDEGEICTAQLRGKN